jgi:hypothetical protein
MNVKNDGDSAPAHDDAPGQDSTLSLAITPSKTGAHARYNILWMKFSCLGAKPGKEKSMSELDDIAKEREAKAEELMNSNLTNDQLSAELAKLNEETARKRAEYMGRELDKGLTGLKKVQAKCLRDVRASMDKHGEELARNVQKRTRRI